eukprot:11175594-Prorocentrum_lima.AAC.1
MPFGEKSAWVPAVFGSFGGEGFCGLESGIPLRQTRTKRRPFVSAPALTVAYQPVSYTHLRAHETRRHL